MAPMPTVTLVHRPPGPPCESRRPRRPRRAGSWPGRTPWCDATGFDPARPTSRRSGSRCSGPRPPGCSGGWPTAWPTPPAVSTSRWTTPPGRWALGGRAVCHSPFHRAILRRVPASACATPRRARPPVRAPPPGGGARPPGGAGSPGPPGPHRPYEEAGRPPPVTEVRRAARSVALDLAGTEPDLATLERRLMAWGLHPALVGDVAAWAWGRRAAASGAVSRADRPSPPARRPAPRASARAGDCPRPGATGAPGRSAVGGEEGQQGPTPKAVPPLVR